MNLASMPLLIVPRELASQAGFATAVVLTGQAAGLSAEDDEWLWSIVSAAALAASSPTAGRRATFRAWPPDSSKVADAVTFTVRLEGVAPPIVLIC